MKKILFIIILAGIGFGLYTYTSNKDGEIEIAKETLRPDPSNATFIFEDGSVTLKDGRNDGDEGMIPTETSINGEPVYADINGDKKNDAVIVLIQNTGGSGLFVYVGAYVSGNVTYKGSNTIFIGDRISPTELSVSPEGLIKLDYLDRADNEPMTETPTLKRTKTLKYSAGVLEEI